MPPLNTVTKQEENTGEGKEENTGEDSRSGKKMTKSGGQFAEGGFQPWCFGIDVILLYF